MHIWYLFFIIYFIFFNKKSNFQIPYKITQGHRRAWYIDISFHCTCYLGTPKQYFWVPQRFWRLRRWPLWQAWSLGLLCLGMLLWKSLQFLLFGPLLRVLRKLPSVLAQFHQRATVQPILILIRHEQLFSFLIILFISNIHRPKKNKN